LPATLWNFIPRRFLRKDGEPVSGGTFCIILPSCIIAGEEPNLGGIVRPWIDPPGDHPGGRKLNSRLLRIATVWTLLLATAWVAEPYLITLWASATEPRTVTARGDLSQAEQATIRLFQTVSPSVVHVFAQGARESSALDEQQQDVVQSGSGIVWDAAGHVITNYHVIKATTEIGARLTSGEFVSARVVGVAPNYDLAVLQVEGTRTPLQPIAVGSSADLQVGQQTFAIGSPYGLDQTLTSGIISALHRRLPTATSHEIGGAHSTVKCNGRVKRQSGRPRAGFGSRVSFGGGS
jgi:hypothetical protein